jgi:Z1 domain
MNETFESARVIAHQFLNFEKQQSEKGITFEIIQTVVHGRIVSVDYFKSIDELALIETLMADFSIGKGDVSIMSNDLKPWLNEVRSTVKWELWNRYKALMQEKDPSFPINDLDDFTDKILDKCENPRKSGSWDRRGMVVGHVQSGKTSNYVGLINKAVDAGYKLVIVIAGTLNSLRRQTQERVDEGFIGTHSAKGNRIGVGKFVTSVNIYPLTSSSIIPDGDFDQKTATRKGIPIGNNPVVLVIKKNRSILENLIDWLASNPNCIIQENGTPKLMSIPTLIIDDEADSASVNSSSSRKDPLQALEDVKTINKLVRTLLNLFDKNTFIGYTATPYANLFIPQEWSATKDVIVRGRRFLVGEDLFPRDFIINIRAAKNYIGAATFFGLENPFTGEIREPLELYRNINDFDPPFFTTLNRTNRDSLPEYIPQSLCTAIKSFILTTAVRRLRGHQKRHNSMLIHVALYVRWIDRIARLVNDQLKVYKNCIAANDEKFLEELKELFQYDFQKTTISVLETLPYEDPRIKHHTWDEVKSELVNAAAKIEVRAVHGTKSLAQLEFSNIEEIDYSLYPDGLSVIAVGGSRLARGITLEGLSVSYYLRTTKMYDSLMQMGRWFGYRPGYVDLCRLFTTSLIYEWFSYITMATEEMRNDFDEMTALLKRPKDFKLKVRNHHSQLAITSISKLYWSDEIRISFSGQNPQTYKLLRTSMAIDVNYKSFNKLLMRLGPPISKGIKLIESRVKYLIYNNVNVEWICDFLEEYRIEQASINVLAISKYIQEQHKDRTIETWNVVVVGNSDKKVFIDHDGTANRKERKKNSETLDIDLTWPRTQLRLGCTVRNQRSATRTSGYYFISNSQIDDIKDRQADLGGSNLPDNAHIKDERAKRKSGLLLLYPLDPRGTAIADLSHPLIGFSIHFPVIQDEKLITYTVTLDNDFDNEAMEDDDLEEF